MTYEEMRTRGLTCAFHPLNNTDVIVVEEIWLATIEICKRIDSLGRSGMQEDEVECENSPSGKCLYEFNGLKEDPTCEYCGKTELRSLQV